MAYDIGPKIGIDGEAEFRKAIQDINENMKTLGTEMKSVASQFDKNDTSTEALTEKNKVLNKQIDEQKNKLDELNKGLASSADKYGENDKVTQGWQRAVNQATADLNNMERELKNNNDTMEKAEKSTDNMADEVKQLGKNADDAGDKTLSLGDMIKANLISEAIIGGVKALGSAMVSLGQGVADAVMNTADYAGDLDDMSQRTGVAAEELQKYSYAAKLSGMETSTLEKAMIKSQKSFADAKEGSKGLNEAYERLGININDIGSSGEAFDATIAALAGIEDETTRNALANDIFGKSYAEMAPLLNQGAEGIAKLKQEAVDLGAVMSDESIANGAALGDSIDQLKTAASGAANSVISLLLPGLQSLAESGSEYMAKFSTEIQSADGDVGKIGEAIGNTLSDVVVEIAERLPQVIEGAKSLITSFADGIKENLPQIIETGTEIVMDLITGLIEALPDIIQSGLDVIISLAKGISDSLPELVPTIVDTVISIVETLLDNLDKIIDAALDMIMALADGLIEALPKLTEKIPTIIEKLIETITDNLPKIIEAGVTIVIKLAEGLIKAIPQLVVKIPDIISAFVKGFASYYKQIFEIGKDLVKKIAEGISDLGEWIDDKVSGFGRQIVSSIKSGITGLADIGTNLVKGIWNGIDNATDWILSKIKGFGGSVVAGIKDFFGIHSPSTVFRDEVGVYLAQGLGEGFTDEMKNITQDINGSIPTDFEMNGTYNMSQSSTRQNSGLYDAFAAVARDIIVPALQSRGLEVTVNPNSKGIFDIVLNEASKRSDITGEPITI